MHTPLRVLVGSPASGLLPAADQPAPPHGTVLLDRNGDLIAEKNYAPAMMGAVPHTVKWAIDEKGLDDLHPGGRPVQSRPQFRVHYHTVHVLSPVGCVDDTTPAGNEGSPREVPRASAASSQSHWHFTRHLMKSISR